MCSIAPTEDDEGDEIVCSPSIDTLESINSACVANLLSEQGVCVTMVTTVLFNNHFNMILYC